MFRITVCQDIWQGTHLAPTFLKVVANSKKLVAIFKDKKKIML